ncbi:MAG: hypothetical protein JWM99_2515 [Verrucomicrobiales bacterium]|nr:hypothetical protein [Verrucomicrobiales bacterium]
MFVQDNVNTNETMVRDWWGTNLAANVKIVFYTGNGFSSGGDGIRLWNATATDAADVVDSIDFGEATRGSAFTYDPLTGAFGVLSTNGVNGAFNAVAADDVGSPGKTTGPTPLTIVQQPKNVVVNPGDTATFELVTEGRPRGSIQWYFKGDPISGGTRTLLSVTNVQADTSGDYYAVVNNGVKSVSSAHAQLVLQSQATAPQITAAPGNLTLTVGQSYTFTAQATGVPQPELQWYFNGQPVADATAGQFTLSGAQPEQSGTYAIVARNAIGSATNSFSVQVIPAPALVITEVMSAQSTNVAGHGDWWEITNFGTNSIPLKGYRFDDSSATLKSAVTITNDAMIAPGESVVFVEGMTGDEFRAWWGSENVTPNVQVITYRGSGLGLSSIGDAINLWNAAASDDTDTVATAVFSTATLGQSFGFNADSNEFGALSEAGTFGAIIAPNGGDIGSPGYIRNHATLPRITKIETVSGKARITWTAENGKSYILQNRNSFDAGAWTDGATVTASGAIATAEENMDPAGTHFYRVSVQ